MSESILWWNSLTNEKRSLLLENLWKMEGNPLPVAKESARRSRGIPVDGWGEKRKMLSAFPGSAVIFELYDGDVYTGICVGVGLETTRQELIEQAVAEYAKQVGGNPPTTCRLRYSETT